MLYYNEITWVLSLRLIWIWIIVHEWKFRRNSFILENRVKVFIINKDLLIFSVNILLFYLNLKISLFSQSVRIDFSG